LSSIVVLDCGNTSALAISVTVAARLVSRKCSKIAKARSADFTAAPAAGFEFTDMPKSLQFINRIMLACGSEVYNRRGGFSGEMPLKNGMHEDDRGRFPLQLQ
jgi:hypothetical protein